MVDVKRKRTESFDSMLRRFNRRLQMSGRILQAKKIRFYKKAKNKTRLKKSALRRVELQEHYDKLKRLGQLPEEKVKRGRR